MSKNRKQIIAIAGAGYVGVSLAVLLARRHTVRVFDIIAEKVEMLNHRQSPVRDQELEEYLSANHLDLCATTDAKSACIGADYVIIAVPTNFAYEKGCFDTYLVESVLQQVREVNGSAIVVIKSTVPLGYTDSLRKQTRDRRILFSPEFLQESRALYDNLYPSRIIVGADLADDEMSRSAREFAELLSESALKNNVDILITGSSEAEAIKLFANTYLALRVCFFNEMDGIAEQRGLNIRDIVQGVCLDSRIGNYYNNPSFGYGGYCLPKDVNQLLTDYGAFPHQLIGAVVESNRLRKEYIAQRIMELVGNTNKTTVGIYRLVMKAGSDNFRETAILDIMKQLCANGIELLVYEPMIETSSEFYGCRVENDFSKFAEACEVIIANRRDARLEAVSEKVYSRDLFGRN